MSWFGIAGESLMVMVMLFRCEHWGNLCRIDIGKLVSSCYDTRRGSRKR